MGGDPGARGLAQDLGSLAAVGRGGGGGEGTRGSSLASAKPSLVTGRRSKKGAGVKTWRQKIREGLQEGGLRIRPASGGRVHRTG